MNIDDEMMRTYDFMVTVFCDHVFVKLPPVMGFDAVE